MICDVFFARASQRICPKWCGDRLKMPRYAKLPVTAQPPALHSISVWPSACKLLPSGTFMPDEAI